MFHDRSLLGKCFRGLVLLVLEYCSAVRCSAADTHLKQLDLAASGAQFLTGGVFEGDIAHRRSVQFYVCCIRSGVTRYTSLNQDRMCQCGLHAVPWSHICILMRRLAAEHRSTAGLLFTSQCPSGTILQSPYSVWDWRVSRAGPMFFIGLGCSIPTIVFYYLALSLLSIHRFVLWGWGLRTDRVYITLSQPCTADLF